MNTKCLITLAAMAMTLAAVQPAAATGSGGLNANQVRKIVKEEVKKIPSGPRGPKGATGPAGMDGLPSLFAQVGTAGFVAPDSPGGITQDNVKRVDNIVTTDEGETVIAENGFLSAANFHILLY